MNSLLSQLKSWLFDTVSRAEYRELAHRYEDLAKKMRDAHESNFRLQMQLAEVDKLKKIIPIQLKVWRERWKPTIAEVDCEEVLARSFAVAFTTQSGKDVLDYLIENYFKPVEFIGMPSQIPLAERNGQMKLMVDILTRVDIGMHPMARQESPSTEKPMDVRI